ncbi:MAG: hypothetical protein GYB66_05295 [Chloroflexi bacterium]|nr:hypothetical protein [Chloroflexota bacterium]
MTTQIQRTQRQQRQLRGFIVVWIGITFLIAIATFVGIYVGTGELETGTATASENAAQEVPLSQNQEIERDYSASAENSTRSNAPESSVADPASDNSFQAEANDTEETGDEQSEPAALDQQSSTEPEDEANNPLAAGSGGAAGPALQEDPTPTPQPEPTLPPIDDREFDLGIQITPNFQNDPQIMDGYMDAAANQLNLNWVKLQVRWEFAEPEPGVYDWDRLGYDLFFQKASEKNLKVLISVVSAPDWARQPGVNLEQHGPPANNQDLATFIGNMISRYPGQIHAVEVWNEMNLAREWTSTGGLSAADYVEMVSTVAGTIRFIDPNVIIVSGALAPTGVNNEIAIDDFIYTDQLIAAGLLDHVDCFGAHHNGYNIGPNVPWDQVPNDPTAVFRGPFDNPNHSWSFYSTLNTYANKIQAAGSDVPLCVTEFGWAVTEDLTPRELLPIQNFEFAEDNTLIEQREYLVEAIQLMEEWDFVWLAFIWNLNFGPESNWDISREYRDNIPYSLIRPNYVPAPVWSAITDMNFRGRPR